MALQLGLGIWSTRNPGSSTPSGVTWDSAVTWDGGIFWS